MARDNLRRRRRAEKKERARQRNQAKTVEVVKVLDDFFDKRFGKTPGLDGLFKTIEEGSDVPTSITAQTSPRR
jgi:hypothetical protein